MNPIDRIPAHTSPFDGIRRVDNDGSEWWSARDLMPLLGYDKWERFSDAVERARVAIHNAGQDPDVQASRLREAFGRTGQVGANYRLTRFGAYMTAMECDSRKQEIAKAKTYFAVRTRQAELTEQPAFDLTNLDSVDQLVRAASAAVAMARHERAGRVAAEAQVLEQAPLVAQAQAHRAGVHDISRQEFAREVVGWAEREHQIKVLQKHVFAYLEHLGLFIKGDRSDHGHATTDAIRRGLAVTEKGTSESGWNYATGKLTPKGQGHAWDRIARHVEDNGTLELPRRIGGAA